MINKNSIPSFDTAKIKDIGVVSLAIRPNQSSQYGVGGLTGKQLQERFDLLAKHTIEHLNEVIKILNSNNVASYISLGEAFDNTTEDRHTLSDFITEVYTPNDGLVVESPNPLKNKESVKAILEDLYNSIEALNAFTNISYYDPDATLDDIFAKSTIIKDLDTLGVQLDFHTTDEDHVAHQDIRDSVAFLKDDLKYHEGSVLAHRNVIKADISTHNSSTVAHQDIRAAISEYYKTVVEFMNAVKTVLDSDETTLDQMSEIVAYIKSNKELIDAITTSKVGTDVFNNTVAQFEETLGHINTKLGDALYQGWVVHEIDENMSFDEKAVLGANVGVELLKAVNSKGNPQLKPEFANSIEECTDTTKLYVLPDGYIYAYLYVEGVPPEITIESKSGGYYNYDANNDAYQWVEHASLSAKLTNKIPVTAGDQLTYRGSIRYGTNKSYLWFDANGKVIDSGVFDSESADVTITAPEGAVALQCSSFSYSTAILEVKWIYCQAALPVYRWANTGHAFVPADYEDRIVDLENDVTVLKSGVNNVLRNKKIIYDGDSICQGVFGGGGYAKIIADMTNGMFVNQAIGGGRLTTASNGATHHSVVDNLPNLPKDCDLYCFEGGINDYWKQKTLGTFSKTDFTGTLDTNTVCGALETIFRYALTNFIGKPICFVISHKIQATAYNQNSSGNTFEDYRNAMVGICQKYSIPYYDAFSESGLNGWNTAQSNAFLTGSADGTADGIHPNEAGYKRYYVPQLMSLFEKIMPR